MPKRQPHFAVRRDTNPDAQPLRHLGRRWRWTSIWLLPASSSPDSQEFSNPKC